jgi:DNA-directed RNA polymerase specialized sigma24 family protein
VLDRLPIAYGAVLLRLNSKLKLPVMATRETVRPLGSASQRHAAPCVGSSGSDDSDAGLLRDAVEGNAAAFEKIAARYDQAILALLLALTGSEQVALDLCHSTLLNAYREMRRRRVQSMYIWFYRMAADQWLAWAGKRAGAGCGTGAPARANGAWQDMPLPDRSPAAEVLGTLSARERLVFALKSNQRLALPTVAQIVDLPQQIVARIFTRAVAKLRVSPRP